MAEFHRILLTGAAGSLGKHLRTGLSHLADTIRLVDRENLGAEKANEDIVQGDLSNLNFVLEATKDCDAIVHFAGTPREQTIGEILSDTLPASYNIYESARRNGVARVIYASSIHAVGYYSREEMPDTKSPHRPDSLYGMTKCFTEDLARLYWDKFALESVCLRICSCFPEPADRRMLWSWLSFADCVRLVEASLLAPRVGFSILYGTSSNTEQGVSNAGAEYIGYAPQDSADGHRARVLLETERGLAQDGSARFVGGWFTTLKPLNV